MGILWDNLFFSFQKLFVSERDPEDAVHVGTSRIPVIKSPNPVHFKEAIFILRDDLFFSVDGDKRSILRKARSAAVFLTLSLPFSRLMSAQAQTLQSSKPTSTPL